VTRSVFIAFIAWALLQCAAAGAALADTHTGPAASANTQRQVRGEGNSRLSRLAQRLADAESVGETDTVQGIGSSSTANGVPAGGTRLLTSTPLLRPGSVEGEADDAAERPGTGSWFLKTATSLGLVIGLALLVRWVYIRLGGKAAVGGSPVVEVLSRTAVAPRSHVMLLRVGGRVLVVSDSSAGMRTLASLDDAEEVADILGAVSAARPNSISKGFGQFLHRFNEDHDQQLQDLDPVGHKPPRTGGTGDTVSGLLSRVRAMGRGGGAP